jgi:putative ABC transport system permease protein
MLSDVSHAARGALRNPVVSIVVVSSLGIGIGVNTAVFSWLQAIVLHPLPAVSRSANLYSIELRTQSGSYSSMSWLEYRDLHERLTTIEDLFAFRMVPLYIGDSGRVERTYGQLVSGNYFNALGLTPAVGRFMRAEEAERAGSEPVAVISYGLWQSRFGGLQSAIGQPIKVNGRELVVIGVAPRRFQGTILGLSFDIWVPATMAPLLFDGSLELQNRGIRGYSAMARLRGGVGQQAGQADLDLAMNDLARIFPASNTGVRAETLTFWQAPRGPLRLFIAALAALQALMLLLLLAVCGNTANLVLARASARQREIAIRLALGAAPWRAARVVVSESVILAVVGAAVGFVIAAWWTPAFIALPLSGLPIRFQAQVDRLSLVFAVLLGVACGLVAGAAPAFHVARLDPQVVFRRGSRSSGRSRLRDILMAIEVGLALIVLVIAALSLRSFTDTRGTDTGFRREGVLLAAYDLTGRPMPGDRSVYARRFASRLLSSLRSQPSIEAAAISSSVPLDIHGLPSRSFVLEGRARADGTLDEALSNTVTPGYFALMGIPLVAGVDFASLDDPAAPTQVIVNEEFVRRYLDAMPATNALGRRLQVRGDSFVIVAVVRNSLYEAFGEPPTPIVYFSFRDRTPIGGEIHVRSRSGAEALVTPDLRRVVRGLDSDLPLFNVRTMVDHIETNLVFRRVPARLFAVLGPLLLLLAASGIYAVVSYAVSQRSKEVAVRMALGATARRVVLEFVAQNLAVAAVGALAGWLLTFVIALDVIGVETIDATVFGGVPLLLLAVAGLACWVPARRATLIDPMAVLRDEG